MKNLNLYLSLLFVLTCAKEDSQAPNTPPSQIVKQYTLTATAGDGGSVTGGGTFASGTQVSLTATPSSGYSFSGWSNGSTTNPLTVTLNSNTSITANFQVIVNSYTLTVSAGEGGSVSTEGGEYEEGTEVTVSAISDGCFNFTQWSDGETSSERVVTVNSNIEVTAEFEFYPNNQTISNITFKDSCYYDYTLDQPFNETSEYEIDNIGWLGIKLEESHDAYYYPTSTDYIPPGTFMLLITDLNYYDFNSDELEDVLIGWTYSPHTVDRETRYNYTILINNGDGTFYADHDRILSSSIHDVLMPYRTMMEDFNGDGIKDIISASMGKIERLPDGNFSTRWERIPLLLSNSDGTYIDASTNIEGQEDGISPPEGHTFGHSLSIGDVDGDNDIDIYTSNILLINDGTGNFMNKTSELSNELRPNNRWNMSSVIDDFNNDGIDDFFNLFNDTNNNNATFLEYDGVYSLSKNNSPSYSNATIGFVSGGKYGTTQTKFNHAVSYDVDLDGYMDVVTSVTRSNPYYVGKSIQVFLNVEDTNGERKFINADYLVSDTSSLDHMDGEGQLLVKDLNNDGILDIAHSSASYGSNLGDQYGLQFYFNFNGQLQLQPTSLIPYVVRTQNNNVSDTWVPGTKLERSFPIDINGNGLIDIISTVHVNRYDENKELVFYSALSKD